MQIIHKKVSSQCTDGKRVTEYTLSHPIDTGFLAILENQGLLSVKILGDLHMFTFQEGEWLVIKGMTGDTMLYVTNPKSEQKHSEERVHFLVDQYSVTKNPDIRDPE